MHCILLKRSQARQRENCAARLLRRGKWCYDCCQYVLRTICFVPDGTEPPIAAGTGRIANMPEFTRRNWLSMAAMTGLAMTNQTDVGARTPDSRLDSSSRGAGPDTHYSCNVLKFGADRSGRRDATAAIQKALDATHRGGGGMVHIPAGRYIIAGSLHIPPCTTLEGVFRGPTSHIGLGKASHNTAKAAGSVLLATGGRGNQEAVPLISLSENSAVLGLCIFHPHQAPDATPVAYPWAISMKGNNCTVENVELLNSWCGIQAVQAHRHLIRNVTGQPLKTGIFVDEVYDIGRIENVHFNPWWSASSPVLEFIYRHGESFVFGRSDWQYVLNTFSFGYHTGYRFIEGKTGSCNGNFLGIGADASWHACVVEQSQGPGILITNGEFVSFNYMKLPGPIEPVQVVVKPGNQGPVRLVNCSFWGPCSQIAQMESHSTIGFGDCTFCQWDPRFAAIKATAGNVCVTGCEFRQSSPQIELGTHVRQAVITGNMAAASWQIRNGIKKRAKIGLNSAL